MQFVPSEYLKNTVSSRSTASATPSSQRHNTSKTSRISLLLWLNAVVPISSRFQFSEQNKLNSTHTKILQNPDTKQYVSRNKVTHFTSTVSNRIRADSPSPPPILTASHSPPFVSLEIKENDH